jgi:hypothetical protein
MSNASSIRTKAFSVLMAVWFLHPQTSARAGTITFDDVSDNVTVVDSTGRITSSVCANEQCFVSFSAPPNTVGVSGSLSALNIREPGLGTISDVFLFAFVQSGGTIQFVSDVEGGPILDPVPGPFIDETGTVQDAATVTWTLANGSTVVDTIAFISDIPEPASAALLCIGLICLGLICGTRARFRLVLRPSSGLTAKASGGHRPVTSRSNEPALGQFGVTVGLYDAMPDPRITTS